MNWDVVWSDAFECVYDRKYQYCVYRFYRACAMRDARLGKSSTLYLKLALHYKRESEGWRHRKP